MKDDYTRTPNKLPPGAKWERYGEYEYYDLVDAGHPAFVVLRDHAQYADGKPVLNENTGKQVKRCIQSWWGTLNGKKPPGAPKLLFNLPQLRKEIKAGLTIYIVEGENKVMLLRRWGIAATCAPEGVGHW